MVDRLAIKKQKWITQRQRCAACGKPPHDLHEIFSRSLTNLESEAREISYSTELCSLLCRECHANAHNDTWQKALLQINYKYYGYEKVRLKYLELKALIFHIIPLPEECTLLEARASIWT